MRSIVRSSLQFRYLVVVMAEVMTLAGIDNVGLSAPKKINLPGGIRYAIDY
jgi:hypothetical protein